MISRVLSDRDKAMKGMKQDDTLGHGLGRDVFFNLEIHLG